jgi:hypothetical protein
VSYSWLEVLELGDDARVLRCDSGTLSGTLLRQARLGGAAPGKVTDQEDEERCGVRGIRRPRRWRGRASRRHSKRCCHCQFVVHCDRCVGCGCIHASSHHGCLRPKRAVRSKNQRAWAWPASCRAQNACCKYAAHLIAGICRQGDALSRSKTTVPCCAKFKVDGQSCQEPQVVKVIRTRPGIFYR